MSKIKHQQQCVITIWILLMFVMKMLSNKDYYNQTKHRISNFIIGTARIEEKFYKVVRIAKSKML